MIGDGEDVLVATARHADDHQMILVNVSGRGDKDIFTVADALGVSL